MSYCIKLWGIDILHPKGLKSTSPSHHNVQQKPFWPLCNRVLKENKVQGSCLADHLFSNFLWSFVLPAAIKNVFYSICVLFPYFFPNTLTQEQKGTFWVYFLQLLLVGPCRKAIISSFIFQGRESMNMEWEKTLHTSPCSFFAPCTDRNYNFASCRKMWTCPKMTC